MASAGADLMTSTDAAHILGVSVRQVQRLVEAGTIANRGRVGRAVLLDAGSVHRLAAVGTARGRAWKASTAWAAMDLLDGGDSTDLTGQERAHRSRLRSRLRLMDAQELVRMTRRRAELTHWRVSASFSGALRSRILITGESALDSRDGGSAVAHELRLGTRTDGGRMDGYIMAEQLPELEREFFLARDVSGNLTLRVTAGVVALADRDYGSRAALPVVALDLAESIDVRERAAALRTLNNLMERV